MAPYILEEEICLEHKDEIHFILRFQRIMKFANWNPNS